MRVVIVGGGFGGVRAALNLAKKEAFEVKLISDRSYFEYHAALYRSATGRSPLEVAIPLIDFFRDIPNVEVIKDQIVKLEPNNSLIIGEAGSSYKYDKLILAVGSVTQYFGISGLKEYSYGVKTIQEALELKRHLHEDLINHLPNLRHYVVVGAGASGVELASELVAYLKHIRKNHNINQNFTVDLIEAADQVLPAMPPDFSLKVKQRLKKLGVRVYLNTPVQAESMDAIHLPGGEIKSQTVVWTAGLTNNPLFQQNKAIFKPERNGKIKVNEYLELSPHIYIIGDSAQTKFSGMAQTALHDANYVTSDLLNQNKSASRKKYQPKKPIYAIPVGPRWSAVLWGRGRVYGYSGWILRRLADLRLYINFLSLVKGLTVWRYGIVLSENCPVCSKKR
jgi:NADH dehydrogenase